MEFQNEISDLDHAKEAHPAQGIPVDASSTKAPAERQNRQWIPVDQGIAIFKCRNSKCWYIDLNLGWEGIRRRRYSLHTTDRQIALTIAREKASAILAGAWDVTLAGVRFVTAAARFCRSRWEKRRKISSAQMRYRALRYFADWLAKRKIVTLDRVRAEHVEAYLRWRRSNSSEVYGAGYFVWHRKTGPLAPATLNRELAHLKCFARWAHKRGYIRRDFTLTVEPMQVPRRVKWTPEPAEVQALLGEISGPLKDFVVFVANTSVRLRDALCLTRDKVSLNRGVVLIYHKKTAIEEEHRLNEAALDVMRRRFLAAGASGILFPSMTGAPLDGHAVYRSLAAASGRAGLQRPITAQALRRFALTQFSRELTQAELQYCSAHTTPRMLNEFYIGHQVANVIPPVTVSS